MSHRKLQRSERDKELLLENAVTESDSEDDTSEEDGEDNVFAMLMGGNEGDNDSQEDEEEEEEEEHDNQRETSQTQQENTSQMTSTQKTRKKKKKKNNKPQQQENKADIQQLPDTSSEDEIEKTLKEINQRFGDTNITVQTHGNVGPRKKNLLTVDPRTLDPSAELKRLFGSRIIQSAESTETAQPRQRGQQVRRRGPRSLLTTPKGNWPRYESPGLSMALLDTGSDAPVQTAGSSSTSTTSSSISNNSAGELAFTFTWSQKYESIEHRFWKSITTHDPNALMRLLQLHPYHPPTILQLSWICSQSGDHDTAVELLERALYAFEVSTHARFNMFIGECRLPYDKFPNRSFHLTLFHYTLTLLRRGLWATAFSFLKLTLSLDTTDPLGILLMIDFVALKAGEYEWVLQTYDQWKDTRGLDKLPGWRFNRALALWMHENASTRSSSSGKKKGKDGTGKSSFSNQIMQSSVDALREAIVKFPWAVKGLLEQTGSTDSELLNYSYFQYLHSGSVEDSSPAASKLLMDIFVHRSFSLWKEPQTFTWFADSIRAFLPQLTAPSRDLQASINRSQASLLKDYHGLPKPIYRHMFICDLKLAPYAHLFGSEELYAFDPVPPTDDRPYLVAMRPAGLDGGVVSALLRTLAPWFVGNNPEGQAPDQLE